MNKWRNCSFKSIKIFLSLCLLNTLCLASIPSNLQVKTDSLKIKMKIHTLNVLADSILRGRRQKKAYFEKKFFKEFPSSFYEFISIYGFKVDSSGHLVMLSGHYFASENVIKAFGNLKTINLNEYYNKLISLSAGYIWDADAINELHEIAINELENNTVYFLKILNTKMQRDIINFRNLCSVSGLSGEGDEKNIYFFYCKLIQRITENLSQFPKLKEIFIEPCKK